MPFNLHLFLFRNQNLKKNLALLFLKQLKTPTPILVILFDSSNLMGKGKIQQKEIEASFQFKCKILLQAASFISNKLFDQHLLKIPIIRNLCWTLKMDISISRLLLPTNKWFPLRYLWFLQLTNKYNSNLKLLNNKVFKFHKHQEKRSNKLTNSYKNNQQQQAY